MHNIVDFDILNGLPVIAIQHLTALACAGLALEQMKVLEENDPDAWCGAESVFYSILSEISETPLDCGRLNENLFKPKADIEDKYKRDLYKFHLNHLESEMLNLINSKPETEIE